MPSDRDGRPARARSEPGPARRGPLPVASASRAVISWTRNRTGTMAKQREQQGVAGHRPALARRDHAGSVHVGEHHHPGRSHHAQPAPDRRTPQGRAEGSQAAARSHASNHNRVGPPFGGPSLTPDGSSGPPNSAVQPAGKTHSRLRRRREIPPNMTISPPEGGLIVSEEEFVLLEGNPGWSGARLWRLQATRLAFSLSSSKQPTKWSSSILARVGSSAVRDSARPASG